MKPKSYCAQSKRFWRREYHGLGEDSLRGSERDTEDRRRILETTDMREKNFRGWRRGRERVMRT